MSVYRGQRQRAYRYKFRFRGQAYRGSTNTTDRTAATGIEQAIKRELRLELGGLVPHRLLKGVPATHLVAESNGAMSVVDDNIARAYEETARCLLDQIAGDNRQSGRQGHVYFISSVRGPIKIGFAANVQARLATLQTASPQPLQVLAAIAGTAQAERAIHRHFASLRLEGEWFQRDGRIFAVIAVARRRQEDFSQEIVSGDSPDSIGTASP